MSLKDKKKGVLICCCREADNNCYLTCPKGRRLAPTKVFNIEAWRKV
jgi:hypothetical protein